ncbi:MAG: lipopolysaccharide transport periplasmic protein LptA [Rhodobacteraceae bacterium]|nr:lipopolysaccharide transport periplasmic protein LptA [Paracoccaceae bacterium]
MRTSIAVLAAVLWAALAAAQGMQVSLGALTHDTSQPVEVSADSLEVDQESGTAVFSGNVLVVQGDMKLSAGSVRVTYASGDDGGIAELIALGGVTFVTETEAAEGREVVYNVDDGTLSFSGDVLLTQGPNALSGDRMRINLVDGTAVVEGRVRTVFQAGEN